MPKNNYSDDQIMGKCKNNCYCIKDDSIITISPVPPPIGTGSPLQCQELKCKGGRCSPSDEAPAASWAINGYCNK